MTGNEFLFPASVKKLLSMPEHPTGYGLKLFFSFLFVPFSLVTQPKACLGQAKGYFLASRVMVRQCSQERDCTEEINLILREANARGIDTVILDSGHYRITAPITVPTGMVIQGAGKEEVCIEQLVWGHPVFDLLFSDEVSICGISLLSRQPRVYPNGFVTRGTDGFVNNAGIYSNGSGGYFRDLTIEGFTCGLHLSAWDGVGLYAKKMKNVVQDISVNRVDFGVLATGQQGLLVNRVKGTFEKQTGSESAPHLVYISSAQDPAYAGSGDLQIRDCQAMNSNGGHAFQLVSVRGGRISNLRAEGCSGILAIRRCENVHFDTLIALRDEPNAVGSLFIHPEQVDSNTFAGIRIDCINPTARILRLDGKGCSYTDMELRSSLNHVSDQSLVTLEGSDSVLRDLRILTLTDSVGAIGVRIQGIRLQLDGLECNSCMAGFTVTADSKDCAVRFDPSRISKPRGETKHNLYFDYSQNLSIVNIAEQVGN